MDGKKEIAWAVEYVENGKKIIIVDYSKHSTPQEAKDSFVQKRGGLREAKKGAKVVQREITVFHPETRRDEPKRRGIIE